MIENQLLNEMSKQLDQSSTFLKEAWVKLTSLRFMNMYYVVEEYEWQKDSPMKKRTVTFRSGGQSTARLEALSYCQLRRMTRQSSAKKRKTNYYQQVRLIDTASDSSYMISGGGYEENIFGLAWEGYFFSPPWTRQPTQYGVGSGVVNFDGEKLYFPNFHANHPNLYFTHFPHVIESQSEITLSFTLKNEDYKTYRSLVKEVRAYEQSVKEKPGVKNKDIEQ